MPPRSRKLNNIRDGEPISSPVLENRAEEKQVEERVTINARVVHETIRREGEEELSRPASALAWSGPAAGLSMGFSLVAEALLNADLPNTTWRPLIANAGYTVGFLMVILGRQQLFTENTLTVILPLLLDRSAKTLLRVLRLWAVVLGSNLVGTFLFALCVGRIHIFNPSIHASLANVSQEAITGSIWLSFVRAIFAGWLIALMVWLLPAAECSRVAIIFIVTYFVGLGHFEHIIAGSTKMFFSLATGGISPGYYFGRFFLPVLAGNIIGGVSLVAFLGHAQVIAGKEA